MSRLTKFPRRCPQCKGMDINPDYETLEQDGEYLDETLYCNDCGATVTAHFEFKYATVDRDDSEDEDSE